MESDDKPEFINLNILLNMSKDSEKITVEKMEITGENIVFSNDRKILRYLKSQLKIALDATQRYESNLPQSELSETFIVKRQEARTRADTFVEIINSIEDLLCL
jgi:hypothetical protein